MSQENKRYAVYITQLKSMLDSLDGKEIPIDIVKINHEVIKDLSDIDRENGLLTYKKANVLLYIPDHTSPYVDDIETIKENPATCKSNRFHISWCEKLQEMHDNKRINRYTVANDASGTFIIEGKSNGMIKKENVTLMVCKYCLGFLNYNGYRLVKYNEKNDIFNNFKIGDFLDKYSPFFPTIPDKPYTKAGYTNEWKNISERYRIKRNWTCEICGVNLQDKHNLLHTHHKNGVKSDNSTSNLIALCAICHGKQPYHTHMYRLYEDIFEINMRRRKQGLISIKTWDDIYKVADNSIYGIIGLLKNSGKNVPDLYVIDKDKESGKDFLIDIAWIHEKRGIATSEKAVSIAVNNGWQMQGHKDVISDEYLK